MGRRQLKNNFRKSHGAKNALDFSNIAKRFFPFMENFHSLFQLHNNNQSENAKRYVTGLLKDGLRNKSIERIVESESSYNYQALQYFISEAKWSYSDVFSKVGNMASDAFTDKKDTGLILDETTFLKKGNSSVGVARQYLGTAGKVDNGQMGLFLSLVNNSDRVLIDGQLYLPKEWTDDEKRMQKAKIPTESQAFKTKEQIALEMIERARKNKISFKWIGGDAGYGKKHAFLHLLDEKNELFVIDVQKKIKVFLEKPNYSIPIYENRGRTPIHEKPDCEEIKLEDMVVQLKNKDWEKISVREGVKGTVKYEYYFSLIYLRDEEANQSRKYRLIIRRDPNNKNEIKFTLSNANNKITKERLAYMQAQRYWIERSFQDAKESCGMKDYQVRTWNGWHHHMALVSMASLFMMKEKLILRDDAPLLSCTDITEIITFYLSKPISCEEELTKRIKKRHIQRTRTIKNLKKYCKPRP